MKVQYASFCLPVLDAEIEVEQLNRFLRGHRVLQVKKELVESCSGPTWSILVEYGEDAQVGGTKGGTALPKVDYKAVLSEADFLVFSALRELRKKIAEEKALPVYALFSNEQLAEMARKRPGNKAEFSSIEGIGQAKTDQYGEAFLDKLKELLPAASGLAF